MQPSRAGETELEHGLTCKVDTVMIYQLCQFRYGVGNFMYVCMQVFTFLTEVWNVLWKFYQLLAITIWIIDIVMGANSTKVIPAHSTNLLDQLLSPQPPQPQPLSILLAKFTSLIKFQKQSKLSNGEQTLKLTQTIVSLYWHPNFSPRMLFWYRYLKDYLAKLLAKKSMIFVTADQWRLCLGLSEFVMLGCDENIRGFLNRAESIKIVRWLEDEGKNETITLQKSSNLQSTQLALTTQQKHQTRDTLREFIYYSLYAKNKIIPNFSVSFTQINRTLECLLCLFLKLEYESPSLQTTGLKRNITICAYVIGLGIEYENCLVMGLGVKFLAAVFGRVRRMPEGFVALKLKAIPGGYFKEIPALSCSNLYETIASYLLLILLNQSQDVNIAQTLDVLESIFTLKRPKNKQLIPLIQKILDKGELKKQNLVKLSKILDDHRKDQSKQPENSKEMDKEVHSLKIDDVQSDQNKTQLGKNKIEQGTQLPASNLWLNNINSDNRDDKDKNSQENMREIYQLYYEIVVRRFIPSINAEYKAINPMKDQEQIMFPVKLKQFDIISSSQKVSKKNSEEDSLQGMNEASEKVLKPFKVEQIE